MRLSFFPLHLLWLTAAFAASDGSISSDGGAYSTFVTAENGKFFVNGSEFRFIGTNAYWLTALESDEDIETTFRDIADVGIQVVRTWAFNDVTSIPKDGVYFQLISNGRRTVNIGRNGLRRLDRVVQLAEKYGIYLILSLTNNWNPISTDTSRTRNFLSNDYGGMDVYVRELARTKEHDQFYRDPVLINAFKDYTRRVVQRYLTSPAILSWELANDPRCSSTLPASSSCNTLLLTDWHNTMAKHIKSIDPIHLVSTGHQGFFCTGCPKRFQDQNARRDVDVAEARIKRQAENLPSFNGSFGIDSEDIISIPEIDFGSFQIFTDQTFYEPDDPNANPLDNALQKGSKWISRQVETSGKFGKPVAGVAFGMITEENLQFFTPFNETVPPFAPGSPTPDIQRPVVITDAQRNNAYDQWLEAGRVGRTPMIHYLWGVTLGQNQGHARRYQPRGPSANDGHSTSGSGNNDFKNNMRGQVRNLKN